MTANPKFKAFLAGLLEATKNGKVDWRDTADEDTFRVELEHGFIHLERGHLVNNDGVPWPWYRAYLYDRKGRLADEISSDDMGPHALLSEMFELARRSARETDSLLDQVSADLQSRGTR